MVTRAVAAGSAGAFSLQVKNTGTDVAQFNIVVDGYTRECNQECTEPAVVLTVDSLQIQRSALGPNGYFTAPIDPGAVATYILKVTPSKVRTTPGDWFGYHVRLKDSNHDTLDDSYAVTYIKNTKGTGEADLFVSSSGSNATSSPFGLAVAAPTAIVGKASNWSMKVKNNSAGSVDINFTLTDEIPDCADNYAVVVKQGTLDVTNAVRAGTYSKTLAAGKAVTIKMRAQVLQDPRSCLAEAGRGFNVWVAKVGTPYYSEVIHEAALVLNVPQL